MKWSACFTRRLRQTCFRRRCEEGLRPSFRRCCDPCSAAFFTMMEKRLIRLMEFRVVRFNEMQKYIGSITFKTLNSILNEVCDWGKEEYRRQKF